MTVHDRPGRVLLALAMLLSISVGQAREPVVPADELRQASIAGVAGLPGQGVAVGLAVEGDDNDEERVVAIFIGATEGAAIARALDGARPPRPMTHELLGDVLQASGAQVRQVVIDELRDGIYYATMETLQADGRTVWIDARPSDSLALAVRLDVPIRVSAAVLASTPDWRGPQARPPEGSRIIETGHAVQCLFDEAEPVLPALSRSVRA